MSSNGTKKRQKGRIDYKAYEHLLRHDNEEDENNASKSEISKSSNAMEIDLMDDISSAPVSEERNQNEIELEIITENDQENYMISDPTVKKKRDIPSHSSKEQAIEKSDSNPVPIK